jgi:8-oxo-dGTP pyrophosphatase MutT (NUDIX family)
MSEENPWQTVASRPVYANPWIAVREDQVIRPDGAPGIYGVVHFEHLAVGVLALDDEDHTWLVGQWRYPFEGYYWEMPEGGAHRDETPLQAAQRELREETGLVAAHWEQVGLSHLSNSVSDEVAIWFRATGLTPGETEFDGTERLALRRLPFSEALAMVLRHEITDAMTQLAILTEAHRRHM